jgi:hypothetical protein
VSDNDEKDGPEGHDPRESGGPGEPAEHGAHDEHHAEHGEEEGHEGHDEHEGRPPPPPGSPWYVVLRYHARPSIALGIVVVATLGSIMSYRAATAEQESARSEHLAAQQEIQRESALSTDNALVDQDLRVFGRLQEHLLVARELRRQAANAQGAEAHQLEVQAQQEVALARAGQTFLQGAGFDATNLGTPRYAARLARQQAISTDQDLERLVPHELAQDAKKVHLRSVRMIGLAAMFIVALFFLTLAEANIGGLRRGFVVVGAIVAVVAIIGGGLV